jgi:hypothetical protein
MDFNQTMRRQSGNFQPNGIGADINGGEGGHGYNSLVQ